MRRLALALALTGASAAPLSAQLTDHLELGAGVSAMHFHSTLPGGVTTLSGVAASGEGRLFLGPVAVQGWYVQGRLTPDTGLGETSDLVEAGLLVAAHPRPWATVALGPQLRAYVLPSGTERWVFFEARGRVEGSVISGLVTAHLEMWAALSTSVTPGTGGSGARGGQAGLTARLPNSHLWVRLAYTVDHVGVGTGGTETLDGVGVSLGWGGK